MYDCGMTSARREVPQQEHDVSERESVRNEPVDPAEGRDIPRGTDEHADADRTRRERDRGATSAPSEQDDDVHPKTT